ncbi:MAG: hypothetical protein ABIJ82_00750 [Patescibacteria group bacterium]|nr:hypothetical protein [Patescibacteria group bacterium]MBU1952894.1 hypothetical protein [Patescibacteria group bacterium]
MFKIVKTVFMLIMILVGLVIIFASYHLYKGFKSGDITSYFMKYAAKSIVDRTKLSPTQVEYLDAGDFESLVKDIEQNITQEQIDCFTNSVGDERAKELVIDKNPTPQEILKLSKCL